MQKLTGSGKTPASEQPIQATANKPKVDVLKAARLGVVTPSRLAPRPSRFTESSPAAPVPGTTPAAPAIGTVLRKSSTQALTRAARRRASATSRAAAAARAARRGQAPPEAQRQRGRLETRDQILERLSNPIISVHEASVLLDVCPTTVRRYTKTGLLPYIRTEGQQRRFYFRDVLSLMRQLESRPS